MGHAPYKTVFFDLDGTLVDNFEAIYQSYCYMAKHFELTPKSFSTVKKTIGGSIEMTFRKLLEKENVSEEVAFYREHYKDNLYYQLKILPGALWLVRQLYEQGVATAVFTNKKAEFARMLCHHVGLGDYLKHVIGTVEVPYKKPEPEYTRYALSLMQAAADTSLMVGDSPYDLKAARVAKMDCYLVATGSHTMDDLRGMDEQPLASFFSLYELGESVFGLKRPRAEAALEG